MALATVDIVRKTGPDATPTLTAITAGTTRAATADDPAPGANNPIPVPTSGTNYSFWVTTRLRVVANPDAHTLNNLRWFSVTTNAPPGVTIMGADASSGANAGYRQATGTVGVSGTQLTQANHTGLDAAPVSVFTLTSSSPRSLGGSTTGTGEFGDHFVFQVGVSASATPASPAPAETFRWRYDEV